MNVGISVDGELFGYVDDISEGILVGISVGLLVGYNVELSDTHIISIFLVDKPLGPCVVNICAPPFIFVNDVC